MRHSKIRLLFPVLAAVILAASQTLSAQPAPGGAAKNSLWKIEGRKCTVHFLGSIHFLKKDFYPLSDPIEKAYQDANILVFETDIGGMLKPATIQKLMSAGMYPAGETLRDNLSKETYASLRASLTKSVGAPGMLDQFKPWMAAMTLLSFELQRLGFDPLQGVDFYFFNKARADEKEVRPLESIDSQMDLFTGLSKEEQELFLTTTLEQIGDFEKVFDDIIQAWKIGDTKKLDALILEAMREHPKVMEKLLTDRNKQWLPKIEELLKGDKNALVIVGAGHLVGPDSVLDLLKAKGFKVEQK
jgi:uncharacterized protein YbaP (TraB family)